MCQEPTELLLIFFDRINLDPKIQIKRHWHQKPTRRHTDQRKFHTSKMESSSSFVQHQPFQPFSVVLRISAWLVAPKRMAKRMQEQKEKHGCGEIQANGDEPGHFCLFKFFSCEQSDCVEKPGYIQSSKSTGWIVRETLCVSENQNSNPDAASSSQGWQRDYCRRFVQRIRSKFKKSNWKWDFLVIPTEMHNADAIFQSST